MRATEIRTPRRSARSAPTRTLGAARCCPKWSRPDAPAKVGAGFAATKTLAESRDGRGGVPVVRPDPSVQPDVIGDPVRANGPWPASRSRRACRAGSSSSRPKSLLQREHSGIFALRGFTLRPIHLTPFYPYVYAVLAIAAKSALSTCCAISDRTRGNSNDEHPFVAFRCMRGRRSRASWWAVAVSRPDSGRHSCEPWSRPSTSVSRASLPEQ